MHPPFTLSTRYDALRNDSFELYRLSSTSSGGDLGDSVAFLRDETCSDPGRLDDEATNRTHEGISNVSSNTDPYGSNASTGGVQDDSRGSSLISADTRGSVGGHRSRSAAWSKPDGSRAEDRPLDLPTWHPFWLRPPVLAAFSVLFACLAASMLGIAVYSQLNNGLSDTDENMAYAHRFGPSAREIPFLYGIVLLHPLSGLLIAVFSHHTCCRVLGAD
jgi:hypothetical protein